MFFNDLQWYAPWSWIRNPEDVEHQMGLCIKLLQQSDNRVTATTCKTCLSIESWASLWLMARLIQKYGAHLLKRHVQDEANAQDAWPRNHVKDNVKLC